MASASAQQRMPPALHARVLGVDGKPVAGEMLAVAVLGELEKRETTVKTADDGVLDFTLPADFHFDKQALSP